MKLNERVRRVLESDRPGHLVTLEPDGSLSVEAGTRNDMGLDEYVVIHGRARVTPGGAPELLQALARTYLGPDVRFPPVDDPPPGHVTRISPTRIGGVGRWT